MRDGRSQIGEVSGRRGWSRSGRSILPSPISLLPSCRRGGTLLWAVAALGVAVAMAPLYVGMCGSLTRLTARGAHRLLATQRGTAELERLRAGQGVSSRAFAATELPGGAG